MMASREGFGPGLRAVRERKGLTLDAIAKSTKINASLLAALERNDLSQWPSGIFRRAFLRSYAHALGIAAEPLLADFQRYFPDDGTPAPSQSWEGIEAMPLPRLTLATIDESSNRLRTRALSAGLELAGVLALGYACSQLTGTGYVITSGALALLYYPVAMCLTGRTVTRASWRLPAWLAWAYKEAEPSTAAIDPLEMNPSSGGNDPAGDGFETGHTATR